MSDWIPQISREASSLYRGLADAIAGDIKGGRLRPGDRLPPQRRLAEFLEVDLTTVSRGYAEAQSRGLIESQVGRGTFVADRSRSAGAGDPRRAEEIDLTMNLPPEPSDPALLERMQEGVAAAAADLTALLRYQSSVGAEVDRQAARVWLAERGSRPDRHHARHQRNDVRNSKRNRTKGWSDALGADHLFWRASHRSAVRMPACGS